MAKEDDLSKKERKEVEGEIKKALHNSCWKKQQPKQQLSARNLKNKLLQP